MENNKSKERNKIIISILSLVLLVVLVVGITYAAFTYTKKGKVENTVRTGKITMDYQEAENGITLNNAYPLEDSVGKVLSDSSQIFDFTVNINLYGNNLPVSFEVTGEKDENSTLNNEDIRIYLERSIDGTSYSSVLEPSEYIPINSVDEFGASANEMVLDKGTTTETVTYNYRLRMWVGQSYKVTGEEKYFTMKVNVYGNDGVTVEVKEVELDQKSATLKLTNTLQLNAKTSPTSPIDSSITWTSSNPKIASVTSSGLVEAKGIGITTITATSSNGKSATASIKVEANNRDITKVYLENGVWSPGTPISYKVNSDTIQDFYILKDNGSTLTLITDNVVVAKTKWNNSNSNSEGPVTVTEALENATSSWTNMPESTYNGATGQATRARILTYDESLDAGCSTEVVSCPLWLKEGSHHWTSTGDSSELGRVWIVDSGGGNLNSVNISSHQLGVRAVIEVFK